MPSSNLDSDMVTAFDCSQYVIGGLKKGFKKLRVNLMYPAKGSDVLTLIPEALTYISSLLPVGDAVD